MIFLLKSPRQSSQSLSQNGAIMIILIMIGFFTIISSGLVVAILDIHNEAYENWQKQVKAEDLKKFGKFLRD